MPDASPTYLHLEHTTWLLEHPGGEGESFRFDREGPVKAGLVTGGEPQAAAACQWCAAGAFARRAGARLPAERELEAAASRLPDGGRYFWQWTGSACLRYAGRRKARSVKTMASS